MCSALLFCQDSEDTIVPMDGAYQLDNQQAALFSDLSYHVESDEGDSTMLGSEQAEVATAATAFTNSMMTVPSPSPPEELRLRDLMKQRAQLLQGCRDLRIRMIRENFQLPEDMHEELVVLKKGLLDCQDTDPPHRIERMSNELSQFIESISTMMMLDKDNSSRDCIHVSAGQKRDRTIRDSGPSTVDESIASNASNASNARASSVDSSRADVDGLDAEPRRKRSMGKRTPKGV